MRTQPLAPPLPGVLWLETLEEGVRAINHYHDRPEHRAATGTEDEHAWLTTALRQPTPTG
jgi:hypothetical protein